jgi:hypothetical protein
VTNDQVSLFDYTKHWLCLSCGETWPFPCGDDRDKITTHVLQHGHAAVIRS